MNYISWFENHANKHSHIVHKLLLKKCDQKQIVEYFEFENMVLCESDFCILYKSKTKCHEMEKLNCFLCGCPNFRFDDEAQRVKSFCAIDSKNGSQIEYNGVIHQDCSNCLIPHERNYIFKNFDENWKNIMKRCKSD